MNGPETQHGPEAPQLNEGMVNREKFRWMEFQERFEGEWGNHELVQPLLHIQSQALQRIERINMLLKSDLPGAYEESWEKWHEIVDLMKKATDLQARILSDQNRTSLGIGPEDDLSATLVHQASVLNFPEAIHNQLIPLAAEIGIEPKNLPEGGSQFFYEQDGILHANIEKMRDVQRQLAKIEDVSSDPAQKKYIESLRLMLMRNEGVAPGDRFMADKKLLDKKGNIDWGRMARLGGIGIAGFYGLIALMQKNWKFAGLSAVALLFLIKPEILKGKDRNSLDHVARLMKPESRAFLKKHLSQTGSSDAAKEIFDRTDGTIGDTKAMNELLSLKQINGSDLDRLFGAEPSAMRDLLMNTPPEDRVRLLKTLSDTKLEGSRIMLLSIVKNEFEPVEPPPAQEEPTP